MLGFLLPLFLLPFCIFFTPDFCEPCACIYCKRLIVNIFPNASKCTQQAIVQLLLKWPLKLVQRFLHRSLFFSILRVLHMRKCMKNAGKTRLIKLASDLVYQQLITYRTQAYRFYINSQALQVITAQMTDFILFQTARMTVNKRNLYHTHTKKDTHLSACIPVHDFQMNLQVSICVLAERTSAVIQHNFCHHECLNVSCIPSRHMEQEDDNTRGFT